MPEKIRLDRSEHLSELSEKYEEHKERLSEIAPRWDEAFGENVIGEVDALREHLTSIEAQLVEYADNPEAIAFLNRRKQEYSDAVESQLTTLETRLAEKFDNDPLGGSMDFFMEIAEYPKVREMLADKLVPFRDKTVPGLIVLFKAQQISIQEFEEIIRQYVYAHAEKRNKFNERLPEILADFKDAATKAIEAGYLPISVERLESRTGDTKIYLADTMDKQLDTGGAYYQRLHAAKISQFEDLRDERHAIFHEMMHTLAGRTILMREHDGDMVKNIESQREGLGFNMYSKDGNVVDERFRWLNEAVTEEITMRLQEIQEGAYEEERKMLDGLYQDGLHRDLVYNAYFENYEPDAKKKVPAWKELNRQLSEIYHIGGVELLKEFEHLDKLRRRKEELQRQIKILEAQEDKSGS